MTVELVSAAPGDMAQPSEWLARGAAGATAEQAEMIAAVLGEVSKVGGGPWGAFWSVAELDGARAAVGLCAYKGAPNVQGEVEIAYFTFPHLEGRGFAAGAADALTRRAAPQVRTVLAHTLQEEGASTAILRRCGFDFAGPCIDPEDGPVWRWEKAGRGA